MTEVSSDDILKQVEQQQIHFVDLQFTDIMGAVKSVTIPAHELPATLDHGIWFDGSSIEGFARIAESDMYLKPDTTTFAVIPWLSGEDKTARFICDVYTPNDQPFIGDPRARIAEETGSPGLSISFSILSFMF